MSTFRKAIFVIFFGFQKLVIIRALLLILLKSKIIVLFFVLLHNYLYFGALLYLRDEAVLHAANKRLSRKRFLHRFFHVLKDTFGLLFDFDVRLALASRCPVLWKWLVLFLFVLPEVLVHQGHVHQTEGPAGAEPVLSTLHQPVELAKVSFISKVKGKGHRWVAFRNVNFAHLPTMIWLSVALAQPNLWELWSRVTLWFYFPRPFWNPNWNALFDLLFQICCARTHCRLLFLKLAEFILIYFAIDPFILLVMRRLLHQVRIQE